MLANLAEDLARIVTVYKNRSEMFRWNSDSTFKIDDVVRHFLFARADSAGFTPIPNLPVFDWTIDVACVRGYRITHLFMVRSSSKQDYRSLLLFPRSVERVVIAMNQFAVPEDTSDLVVIKVPRRPTQPVSRSLSVRKINNSFNSIHNKVYGMNPPLSAAQAVGVASRMAAFWSANGAKLDFEEYAEWFLRSFLGDSLPGFQELIDRNAISNFRLMKQKEEGGGEWTNEGW